MPQMPDESSKNLLEDQEFVSFCSRVEKGMLRKVLEKLRVTIDEHLWDSYGYRNGGVLIELIAGQNPEVRDKAQRALNEIASVGRKKLSHLILKSLNDWGVKIPEGFGELTAPNMASWCYVNLPPEEWHKLSIRAETKNHRPGEWHVFELEFDTPPEDGSLKNAIDGLQDVMSETIMSLEHRGDHCRSDCFTVDREETVIFKLTDHPDANEVWSNEEDNFRSMNEKAAFRIVVSFDYDSCRLSIYYPDVAKQRISQIANAFSSKAFGSNFRHAEQVLYTISSLLRKTELPGEPALGVKSARAVGLDLELDNSKKRRRSYFEEEQNLAQVIRNELGETILDDSEVKVVRAHVRLEFTSCGNSHHRTFTVSPTGVKGWKTVSSEMRGIFLGYAKKIGLVANGDNSNAG